MMYQLSIRIKVFSFTKSGLGPDHSPSVAPLFVKGNSFHPNEIRMVPSITLKKKT